MVLSKRKGYRVERKVRKLMEENGWKVVRATGSLGDVDLVGLRKGKCILLQVKSTKKKKFYFYGVKKRRIEGFDFFVVVDFGKGNIRITRPKKVITSEDGRDFVRFIKEGGNKI